MAERTTVFIGCDLGDKYSHACVLDAGGSVVQKARLRTTAAAFREWFARWPRAQVVLEVGTHSRWASRAIRELGHDVIVANARNVQLISKSQRKTDKRDAELLARLGRHDPFLLGPISHRGEKAHSDLAVIKGRDVLVAARTQLVNHVRGMVKPFGVRVPRCQAESFSTRAQENLPAELARILTPVLRCLDAVQAQIDAYDLEITTMARERYPETARLTQVDRVGPITSLAFVLTLEDPTRFKKSRTVGAFLGLATGKRQSGESDPETHITKAGDPLVRRLLVQCANQILTRGRDCDLKRWGLRIAARGRKAARNRAIVAVARKLAVLLHRLWVTGQTYEPLRNSSCAAIA